MGNKFSRVLPEMLVGYSLHDDGSYSSSATPLPQLKVMCVTSNEPPVAWGPTLM